MTTVYRPPHIHHCAPGWTWTLSTDTDGPFAGKRYGTPPEPSDFPPGTVWECSICGKCWVVKRPPTIRGLLPGVEFRPERRVARWRRLRRAARDGPARK